MLQLTAPESVPEKCFGDLGERLREVGLKQLTTNPALGFFRRPSIQPLRTFAPDKNLSGERADKRRRECQHFCGLLKFFRPRAEGRFSAMAFGRIPHDARKPDERAIGSTYRVEHSIDVNKCAVF